MDLLPLTAEEISETFDNVHISCLEDKSCRHASILNQIDQSISCDLLQFLQYLMSKNNGPAASILIFSEGVLCGLVLSEVLKLKSLATTE